MGERLSYRIGRSYEGLFRGTNRDQFTLVEGRRGTAKTASILKHFCVSALKYPKTRYLIARSTRVRLSESVITTFNNHVLPSFRLKTSAAAPSHCTGYDFYNGSRFIFMALDDPGRSQSVEADGAYISEATELESADQATSLTAAIRPRLEASANGKPSVDPYPNLMRQVVVDCNPGPPGHWLNKIAEPAGDDLRQIRTRDDYERTAAFNLAPASKGWKRIITSLPDNPGYWDSENWCPTSACQKFLDGMGYMSKHMQSRWVDGLWVAAEGSVFGDVFDLQAHVIDDFDPPADWPWYVGWDPGIDHPTGMCWVSVAPNGDIFVGDEVCEGGKSIASHVQDNVMPRLQGRTIRTWMGDPHHFFSSTAQSPKCCADQAQEAGLSRAVEWADLRGPAKQAGVNALIEILQNTVRVVAGQKRVGPCLFVMRRCVNTIAEFQSWCYRRNAKGEQLQGDDAYEDKNNHLVGDPLVGMIASQMLVYEDRSGTIVGENVS